MGEGYTYIYIPVHFSKDINLWAILKDWILRLNYQMMLHEQLQMVINGDIGLKFLYKMASLASSFNELNYFTATVQMKF